MDVISYTDRMSVTAGERLSLMISSVDPKVNVSLVEFSGLPAGSGMPVRAVPSSIEGAYSSGRQPLRTGSYVLVDDAPPLHTLKAFSTTLWVMPTLLSAGEQTLIAKSDHNSLGWNLGLKPPGRLRLLIVADNGERCDLLSPVQLQNHVWYFVGAAFDGSSGRVEMVVCASAAILAESWTFSTSPVGRATTQATVRAAAAVDAPLLIAGSLSSDQAGEFVSNTFNGKIAMPRLFQRALTQEELLLEAQSPGQPKARSCAAAWDFAQGIESRRVTDVSGNNTHGRTVQQPTRAVTGPRWDGGVTSWKQRPELYDAIHFHDDDLDDAQWQPTVTWTVDRGLSSGIYAARVEGQRSGEDLVPFIIRPPRGRATAQVLFVAPLFSWLAYGNLRQMYHDEKLRTSDRGEYVVTNRLNGLYDRHSDASSVCFTSWQKPNLHIRPDYRLAGFPHQFSADLLATAWLRHEGIDFDVVTDEDLHREGAELLNSYRVVISGTHAEYWSAQMLDGLTGYLHSGGRYMYLSGNGLYRVTAFDDDGYTIEVRRQEYSGLDSARLTGAGEGFMSLSGEPGVAWRWRGRAPQRYVGVGTSGMAFPAEEDSSGLAQATGSPYRRQPGSFASRAAFISDGLDDDELIGDFPNVIGHHGAAGFEIDRADPTLGTPQHALIIATATAMPGSRWTSGHDDEEDQKTVTSEVQAVTRECRADMVFFETQPGGAVFSTGSVAWCGALAYNNYNNTVATISRNVLRRFLDPTPFTFPELL